MCHEHIACPVNRHDRFQGKPYKLTVENIVETANKAKDLGFSGYIAYHRYNSPTMYWSRVKPCIEALADFKHLLWDSGNILKEEMLPYFDCIHISNYRGHNFSEWQAKYPEIEWHIRPVQLDDRLANNNWTNRIERVVCNRPKHIELPIDHAGNIALCCYDWNADHKLGNIFEDDFTDIILNQYQEVCQQLAGGDNPPSICKRCPYPYKNTNLF